MASLQLISQKARQASTCEIQEETGQSVLAPVESNALLYVVPYRLVPRPMAWP